MPPTTLWLDAACPALVTAGQLRLAGLRQLVDRQQWPALAEAAQQALADEPDAADPVPLLALAQLQLARLKLGSTDSARQSLAQAEAALPTLDDAARVDLAAAYLLHGQPLLAQPLLEQALRVDPTNGLALARLAGCHLMLGQRSVAQELFAQSALAEPWRVLVWIHLVELTLAQARETATEPARTHLLRQAETGLQRAASQLQAQRCGLPEAVALRWSVQLKRLQLECWVLQDQLDTADCWLEEQAQTMAQSAWVALVLGHALLLAGIDRHAAAEVALRRALQRWPGDADIVLQLVDLSLAQGQWGQATGLLRSAIARDGANPDLHAKLSGVLLRGRHPLARESADRALALVDQAPDTDPAQRHRAWLALAQVESDERNPAAAQALFDQILQADPQDLLALQACGQHQMLNGQIDAAVALFERVKAIDPVAGASALIHARHFPDDEASLDRIEQAARLPSLEGSVRSSLLFQLAAAWDKRADHDQAFALAREANEASKRQLRYDAADHRQQSARIRARFSAALFKHRPDCGVDSTLPIYVLGMPRSGTTLVEQIIAGHSQIFGAGELSVIPQVIAGLERWERHTGSGRHYPDCVDDLTPEVVQGIANDVLKTLQALAPEARCVVDKLPHNFENIGLIKFLFPQARILSVRRDARDIAISNYFTDYQAKHSGMGFAYDLGWIGEQLDDHALLMQHWQQLFPGQIHELWYEDLVDNTEAVARRMLDYIGVGWEPEVLNFNALERPVKTASLWQVRQPIYRSASARWQHYSQHLAPLGAGRPAQTAAITDMLSLPLPGLLGQGTALYQADELDAAEHSFKKLLRQLPDHAAANFMTGLIYLRKGHRADGIALMAKAQQTCPWNRPWRQDLIQAYELHGEPDKAQVLKQADPG